MNAEDRNFAVLRQKFNDVKFDLDGTDYEASETIGSGTYGVVCAAFHRPTGKRVAIKKIPNIFENCILAKRTLRELKILRHFKHDNIIAISDVLPLKEGEDSFRDIYLVMDLIETDLYQIIRSKQPLTDDHIRYFIYQVACGLKYIHSANVIHRDLKPSNLLVNGNCLLKIADFGMARCISSDEGDRNLLMTWYVATRWYRAPELMLFKQKYTGAVDIWSVGCILAELLGRKPIFPGRNFTNQIQLIFEILGFPSEEFIQMAHADRIKDFIRNFGHKASVPLKNLYPKSHPKAIRLLEKMLKQNPNERISAVDILNDLYVNQYHDLSMEPACLNPINFNLDEQKLDACSLRKCIYEEIMGPSSSTVNDERPEWNATKEPNSGEQFSLPATQTVTSANFSTSTKVSTSGIVSTCTKVSTSSIVSPSAYVSISANVSTPANVSLIPANVSTYATSELRDLFYKDLTSSHVNRLARTSLHSNVDSFLSSSCDSLLPSNMVNADQPIHTKPSAAYNIPTVLPYDCRVTSSNRNITDLSTSSTNKTSKSELILFKVSDLKPKSVNVSGLLIDPRLCSSDSKPVVYQSEGTKGCNKKTTTRVRDRQKKKKNMKFVAPVSLFNENGERKNVKAILRHSILKGNPAQGKGEIQITAGKQLSTDRKTQADTALSNEDRILLKRWSEMQQTVAKKECALETELNHEESNSVVHVVQTETLLQMPIFAANLLSSSVSLAENTLISDCVANIASSGKDRETLSSSLCEVPMIWSPSIELTSSEIRNVLDTHSEGAKCSMSSECNPVADDFEDDCFEQQSENHKYLLINSSESGSKPDSLSNSLPFVCNSSSLISAFVSDLNDNAGTKSNECAEPSHLSSWFVQKGMDSCSFKVVEKLSSNNGLSGSPLLISPGRLSAAGYGIEMDFERTFPDEFDSLACSQSQEMSSSFYSNFPNASDLPATPDLEDLLGLISDD